MYLEAVGVHHCQRKDHLCPLGVGLWTPTSSKCSNQKYNLWPGFFGMRQCDVAQICALLSVFWYLYWSIWKIFYGLRNWTNHGRNQGIVCANFLYLLSNKVLICPPKCPRTGSNVSTHGRFDTHCHLHLLPQQHDKPTQLWIPWTWRGNDVRYVLVFGPTIVLSYILLPPVLMYFLWRNCWQRSLVNMVLLVGK